MHLTQKKQINPYINIIHLNSIATLYSDLKVLRQF